MYGRALAAVLLLLAAQPVAFAAPDGAVLTGDGRPGVFERDAEGSMRHIASGLICSAAVPGYDLEAPDVWFDPLPKPHPNRQPDGCLYDRIGCKICAAALLLAEMKVEFIKAPDGATLDSVFAKVQAEILAAHPNAAVAHPALHLGERDDYRAAGYDISTGGNPFGSGPFADRESPPYHWELIVGLRHGWIVKVLAMYPHAPFAIDNRDAMPELKYQIEDIQSAYVAYARAMGMQINPAFAHAGSDD
ncbi:MAG: hypothetical protein JSR60_02915 [Proteobacteria bacterium]|nr:hypothetical protein [Pseudomonadota bacterium]